MDGNFSVWLAAALTAYYTTPGWHCLSDEDGTMIRFMLSALGAGCAILAVAFPTAGRANNDACWGDDSREDISCTKLTEPFLFSLRGMSRAEVQKAMNAPGRETQAGSLHFLSNHNRGDEDGSGYLNVTFKDDRAVTIQAEVDTAQGTQQLDFVWNAYAVPGLADDFDRSTMNIVRQPYCSDFSGLPMACKGHRSFGEQLMLYKMSFGATRSALLQVLNASCNVPGVMVSDPNHDCERYRRQLQ